MAPCQARLLAGEPPAAVADPWICCTAAAGMYHYWR